jgi:hypothetical protein
VAYASQDLPDAAVPATPDPSPILQLGMGFWASKTLLSAVELGVFTELAHEPLDAETLRARLGLHPRGTLDFLDALVALGMLQRDERGYVDTSQTALFLDRTSPAYIGGLLEMANDRLYPFWASLTEGLRTGQPQNEIKTGGDFFGVLYDDPERLRQFMRSMTGLSTGAARAIAAKFPWDEHETFVDVGTAEGGLPVTVALAHEHISGGGLDLPAVGPLFDDYVAGFGLSDRLRFHPGEFFADPLPHADVLAMGHILHDWDLEQKMTLLAKAHQALPDEGALIVFDAIIDDERRTNAFGLLMSLNMLIEVPGGFDYTGADCEGWMKDAGFASTRTEPLIGPDSMVVGIK